MPQAVTEAAELHKAKCLFLFSNESQLELNKLADQSIC